MRAGAVERPVEHGAEGKKTGGMGFCHGSFATLVRLSAAKSMLGAMSLNAT